MDGVVEQVGQGGLGEKTFLYVVVTVHSQRELPAHHQGELRQGTGACHHHRDSDQEKSDLMLGRGLASMMAGSQESSNAIPPATISFGQFVTAKLSNASA